MITKSPQTEANVQQAVPFFWVRDIDESVRFYVDQLGFKMRNEWVDDGKLRWCWLYLGHAALMLQETWKDGPHRNDAATPVGVGVSINFVCKDAIALYHDITSRGAKARRPFVGNRMWVTEVTDPDGFVLFFESPTDAPEESVLPTIAP